MAKLTKKMKAIKAGVDSTKAYEINEAIAVLKQFATAKFVESVDVAVNLGIDPRKSDQNVRGATVLPHGTGREVRVAVFTQGANADAAKEAADVRAAMKPVRHLIQYRAAQQAAIKQKLAEINLPEAEAYYLPFTSDKNKEWIALLNKQGKIVGYLPIDGFIDSGKNNA